MSAHKNFIKKDTHMSQHSLKNKVILIAGGAKSGWITGQTIFANGGYTTR